MTYSAPVAELDALRARSRAVTRELRQEQARLAREARASRHPGGARPTPVRATTTTTTTTTPGATPAPRRPTALPPESRISACCHAPLTWSLGAWEWARCSACGTRAERWGVTDRRGRLVAVATSEQVWVSEDWAYQGLPLLVGPKGHAHTRMGGPLGLCCCPACSPGQAAGSRRRAER